jgi:hypothetical protein
MRHEVTADGRYRQSGFGYANYDEDHPHYGISLSSPAWVTEKLQRLADFRISRFSEQAWGHHDIYAVKRAGTMIL